MNVEKVKEMLKSKKGIVISSTVVALVAIGAITGIAIHNKSKVEVNNKIVESNKKDNTEEKEIKDKLEELKKIDISKLSEEERKDVESKISDIEKLISKKEYAKAKTNTETVKSDINTKIEELAKKEEAKEENKEEKTEVASNTTSNNTSTNNSQNTSNSNNGSSSNQGTVQQPTTPPVQFTPQPKPEPTPQPTPKPPVVETPSYPSAAEVKQRLIAYGQSLGLTYDTSINSSTEGTVMQGTDQMWSSERGNSPDQWIVTGLKSTGCYAFNVEVVDLGNGFCSMKAYGVMNWD